MSEKISMLVIGLQGTQDFGAKLASVLVDGDCILLKGDLGAGKTALADSIIRALHGGDVSVISPTFNLLQTYDIKLDGNPATLSHYDLYRLESVDELQELSLDDALESGITIIEWPEIAQGWLPSNVIEVAIEFSEDNENRKIYLSGSKDNESRLNKAGLC